MIHSPGQCGMLQFIPLRARRPRRHTSAQRLALIPNCHIPARASTTSRARLCRSMILSALSPDHALTVLFVGSHASRTSCGSPILGMLWPLSRLTLEFLLNPKPVSSQKASC
ncbi:hypothetical protein ACFX16_023238 [Malus domestica]